jgi:hypothetical protein
VAPGVLAVRVIIATPIRLDRRHIDSTVTSNFA